MYKVDNFEQENDALSCETIIETSIQVDHLYL